MANYIKAHFDRGSSLLIVAGSGNNGADGIVLARLLYMEFDIRLYTPFKVKSPMAKLQLDRTKRLGVEIVDTLMESDIVVDALFGAGLNRELDSATVEIVEGINSLKGFKIACDIPTGISIEGNPLPIAIEVDTTITMGALKESLYSDRAKESVGEIICVDLGVTRDIYEIPTDSYLLDRGDLKLPIRTSTNTHKGSFGHLAVISGVKEGASILSAMVSLRFGVGLVSLVGEPKSPIPYSIMQSTVIPHNSTAIAFGMGFGDDYSGKLVESIIGRDTPLILDADIFHSSTIKLILDQTHRAIVITPHPKEFVSLWATLYGKKIDIATLQSDRLGYVRKFCSDYPHITLILKGANSIIAKSKESFINPHGTAKLSKGGSGDVLSGLIGSLLAQGYSPLESAISSSLALTIASDNYSGSSYSMLPTDLIEEIGKLEKNSSTI
jgi:hydroxyethylthiazole kinase-like uncharacterized protein yjeF